MIRFNAGEHDALWREKKEMPAVFTGFSYEQFVAHDQSRTVTEIGNCAAGKYGSRKATSPGEYAGKGCCCSLAVDTTYS